jgi:catechol 2,3-dioxygenase-like lactoylglutathione lyase family enzyme
MSLREWDSLDGMSKTTQASTTISNIGVAMFTIADQDAAIAYYTQTLGWELRADVPFGDEGGNRWVEVAPPGSTARLALNSPMGDWEPGGSAIGVETPDVEAEYARVQAIDAVKTGEMMGGDGPVPRMFSIEDPDGNHIWVVQSA